MAARRSRQKAVRREPIEAPGPPRLARVLDLPYLREPQHQRAGDPVGAVEETAVYTDAHRLIGVVSRGPACCAAADGCSLPPSARRGSCHRARSRRRGTRCASDTAARRLPAHARTLVYQNRVPIILRDAILVAARELGEDGKGKDGLVGYLKKSRKNPIAYITLLRAVLPLTVTAKLDIDETITYRSAQEVRRNWNGAACRSRACSP